MRIALSISLLALLLAACSITDDDEDPTPTDTVITSTPTEEDDDAESDATSTGPEEGEDSATTAPTEASEEQSPTSTPDEEPSPEATEPDDDSNGGETSEVEAEVEQIEEEIIEVRGLEAREDISVEVIDRETLRGRVEEIVGEDYTQEEADQETLTYWLLGMLPDRDLDLYQLQVELLEEQIAGYYDADTTELVVVTREGELRAIDKVTTAHEIVHALQDQHFDLIELDESVEGEDERFAMTALIEGDATVAMTLYMLESLDPMELAEIFEDSMINPGETDVLENAPRYVAESLTFPYEAGQVFVEALHQEGGFELVNAAFEDPPTSTEQILHPEKYLADDRDEPLDVSTTDLTSSLGDGWEMVVEDTLGEWDIQIMLEELETGNASDAAQGWGGTEYAIYQADDEALATLATAWDTDEDRAEFLDSLQGALDGMDQEGDLAFDGERYLEIIENDGQVTLVTGTSAEVVTTAVEEIGT